MCGTCSRMHARRYSLLVLGTVTALVMAVGSFNLSVDPYLLWRSGGHVGYAGDELGRLTKAHWIEGFGADLVILGNSHAAGGFSEESFRSHGLAERPFNGAFPAAQIYEMRRYFQHYAEQSDLHTALLVVDILNFMNYIPVGEAFDEDRLSVSADGAANPRWWLDDVVYTNFTGAGLQASMEALIRRRRPDGRDNGFRPCTPQPTKTDPSRALTLMGASYVRFLDQAFLDEGTNFDWRGELKAIFAEAERRDIKLYVVIPPAHVTYYMELEAAGYWPAYLDMVRDIATLADGAGGDIEVFDFTGFTRLQTEPVEAERGLIFWRDTNHFSCRTGELMVARLSGDPVSVRDFGEKLTADNVAAYLARLEADKQAWKRDGGEYCRYLKMMPEGFPTDDGAC
ncbi:hypothetical protein [Microbaculum marinum]|uniref:AlgX/AlgJ SGNH hydrolase-like domain-containing protein n=1 Tax=Microbaculum marinum TaxID=1764581 RepID=A0AAW9RVC1_9HYPH